MAFSLGPAALSGGYRLAAFDTIASTSGEARRRLDQGDPGRLWIVAGEQTAGYGRRGRAWQTPRGNLAASVGMVPEASPARIATLGFAAGLAVVDAIERSGTKPSPPCGERVAREAGWVRGSSDVLTHHDIRLKWPNDILIDSAKVAGILLEAVSLAGERTAVIVGIGVNVRHVPQETPYLATSLADCGADATAESLLMALTDAWVEQSALWDDGRGFAEIRRRWLDRAAGLGGPIAVRSGDEVFRGVFETIDGEGRLVVRAPDGGARRVSAGEVHFGAAATAAV